MSKIPDSQEPHEELPPTDEEMLARGWAQFQSEFPAGADCREQLYKGTYEFDILRCRSCTSADVSKGTNGRTINCNACQETTSLTAGTFFSYVKRPRAWWAAIWLREHGIKLNASQLERLVGLAYSTAWNILKKLDMVIAGEMPADAATFHPSAFTRAICKRSTETPARAHPVAEIVELEKELPDNYDVNAPCSSAEQSAGSPDQDAMHSESTANLISDSRQKQELGLGLSTGDGRDMNIAIGREKELHELLSGEPVHFETLLDRTGMSASELSATLTIMELSGAAKCLPGDRYVRSCAPEYQDASRMRLDGSRLAMPAETLPLVSIAVDFLREAFHGVSVKYLQLCLGAYWCYRDRATWAIGSLLRACQKLDPIRDADVLAYKSPVLIKVPC